MERTRITSDDQIKDMLDWALAGNKALSTIGSGSKQTLGRPVELDAQMDISGLAGVEMYEPAELVMKARAGTKLADVKSILLEQGQELAFDPPDYGQLLGFDAGHGTLGGLFSCNMSGSRRVKAGAARDHLLGVQGFTGRGQPFHTGSRVMKNVTGYDLCKLVAGSYGTLAVATNLTFKVLPKAEKTRTVLVFGVELETAVGLMRDGISSVHDVTSAAYLPDEIATRTGIDYVAGAGTSVVAFRIEGPGPSAEFRCNAIRKMMSEHGNTEELHGHNSETLWAYIGDVTAFAGSDDPVWKLSIPPSKAVSVIGKIREAEPEAAYYLDWAGGLIWLGLRTLASDGGANLVRGTIGADGHATLMRGSEKLRRSIAPFHPLDPVVAKITRRIKVGFDPQNILNPQRMYSVEESQETI